MLHIQSLLNTLTDVEVNALKKMQLKGKQLQVMCALLDARNTGAKVQSDDFDITREHFHQILSVLLQRSYATLAPDDPIELLTYLLSKNLTKLFYQQLKIIESKAKTDQVASWEEFYHTLFECAHWVTYDELNPAIIERFARRYLKAKDGGDVGDRLYVEIRILRSSIMEVYAGGSPAVEERKQLERQLERFRRKVEGVSNHGAHYQLHLALVQYYILIGGNPLAALMHLRAAEQFVASAPKRLLSQERYALAAQYAELEFLLVSSQSAYTLFKRLWADPQAASFVRRDYYFTIRFAEVATITGNQKHAISILDKRIHSGGDNLFIASKLMRYIVIALLENRLPEARAWIEQAFRYNTGRSYTFFTDIRVRFLEVAYSYFSGDWQLTLSLINRAMQLLQRKNVRVAHSDFGYYFKYVDAAIRCHETGKPISQKILAHCKREGHFCFFTLLLDKIGEHAHAARAVLFMSVFTLT